MDLRSGLRIGWLALAVLATTVGNSTAGEALSKFYPFEKATIVYALTGLQTGEQTIYVKDWGATQATYIDSIISVMGYERPFKSVTVSTPEWVHTADLTSNTGMRLANPMRDVITSGEGDIRVLGEQMMTAMGAIRVGEDARGGQTCTVWEIKAAGTKLCFRDDNVLIYTHTDMMGQIMEINLVSVEKGQVDSARFTPPDVQYSDAPAGLQFPGAP